MQTRNDGPLFHNHEVAQAGQDDRWFNLCFAGQGVRISDCVGDYGSGYDSFGYTHIPDLSRALESDGVETYLGVRWFVTLWGHRYVHEPQFCQTGQLSLKERQKNEFLGIVRRHLAGERIIYRGSFGDRSERNWGEMTLMPGQTQTELRVIARGTRRIRVRASREKNEVETHHWEQVFTFPNSALQHAPSGCDFRTACAAGLPIEVLQEMQAKIEGSCVEELGSIFRRFASEVTLELEGGPLSRVTVMRPEITDSMLRGRVMLRSDRRVLPFEHDALELFNAIGPGEAARGIELGGFTVSGETAMALNRFFWGYA